MIRVHPSASNFLVFRGRHEPPTRAGRADRVNSPLPGRTKVVTRREVPRQPHYPKKAIARLRKGERERGGREKRSRKSSGKRTNESTKTGGGGRNKDEREDGEGGERGRRRDVQAPRGTLIRNNNNRRETRIMNVAAAAVRSSTRFVAVNRASELTVMDNRQLSKRNVYMYNRPADNDVSRPRCRSRGSVFSILSAITIGCWSSQLDQSRLRPVSDSTFKRSIVETN